MHGAVEHTLGEDRELHQNRCVLCSPTVTKIRWSLGRSIESLDGNERSFVLIEARLDPDV